MNSCSICGSHAINPSMHGRKAGKNLDLCDVCYWRVEAYTLEARIAELTEELIEELEEVFEFAPACTSSKEYAEKRLKELKG